ncbi:MAG: hypothetical protein WBD40_14340, partial [Tepidisphaeraceae bacterium]
MSRIIRFPRRPSVVALTEPLESRRLFAAGDLDPTFSGDGRQTIDLGARGAGLDVAVQSDGKTIVAGQASSPSGRASDAVLIRYNVDGSLDTSFGTNGVARIDFGGNEVFRELAILPSGKIIAGGQQTDTRWMLARFTANGVRDAGSGFGGTDGVQVGDGQIAQVALQGGRIITADGNSIVRRHNGSTGTIDTTFGSGGSVVVAGAIPWLVNFRRLADVAVQGDGRIVLAGVADGIPNDEGGDDAAGDVMGIGRLTLDGAADGSFGNAGGVRKGFDAEASISRAVGVRAGDGAIFVAGTDGGQDANLLQLSSSGTFVANSTLPANSGEVMSASTILFDAQNRVLVVGELEHPDASVNESLDLIVARLTPERQFDVTFAADGEAYVDFPVVGPDTPNSNDFIGGAALDPQGRIVLGGTSVGIADGAVRVAAARLETPPDGPVTFFRDTGELVIDGTFGADTITLSTSGGTLTLNRNGDISTFTNAAVRSITIDAMSGDDNVTLDAGVVAPAWIQGGFGFDTLQGGSGDDTLLGGQTSVRDVIRGGAGVDLASYEDRTANLVITLDGVANDGGSGENDDLGADIENVRDGSGADHITGNNGANRLEGRRVGELNDTLIGLGGNDTLIGAARADGGSGDDLFRDVILADYSARTDSLTFDVAHSAFGGAAGESDVVELQFRDTILQLGSGNDTVKLASSFTTDFEIRAGAGNDFIDMRPAFPAGVFKNFVLRGEAGNDTIFGGDSFDTISGGAGADSLDGANGPDNLLDYSDHTAGVNVSLDGIANDGTPGENDVIVNFRHVNGGSGDDTITGDGGDNVIHGFAGNDTLHGLGGPDT